MANNNLKNGLIQINDFMLANSNYKIELIPGNNPKQAVRMHVFYNEMQVANISTSAFYGKDFMGALENLKANNNSMATSKVEHANKRGNYDKQVKTYCKDELYMLNYASNDTTLDIDKNYSSFNWINFLQGLVNNGYIIDIDMIIYYREKAKEYFNTNPVGNFIKIGKNMFLTKHTYKKVIAIKRKYMEYLKENKLVLNKNYIACKVY